MEENNYLFKKYFRIILILFILTGVCFSSAKKKKRKIYTVDFQDEFVEGHVKNPTIFQLFNKQRLEYEKMVDLRKDFLPEMRRTAGEIE